MIPITMIVWFESGSLASNWGLGFHHSCWINKSRKIQTYPTFRLERSSSSIPFSLKGRIFIVFSVAAGWQVKKLLDPKFDALQLAPYPGKQTMDQIYHNLSTKNALRDNMVKQRHEQARIRRHYKDVSNKPKMYAQRTFTWTSVKICDP